MVAQRLHVDLCALVHHYGIVITTGGLHSQSLELVHTTIGTIFTLQLTLKWLIWSVRRSFDAHDIAPLIDFVPAVRVAIRAQRLVCASAGTSVRTQLSRKFTFQLFPTTREVRCLVTVWWIGNVVVLANIASV
jgi:hypothetical protein